MVFSFVTLAGQSVQAAAGPQGIEFNKPFLHQYDGILGFLSFVACWLTRVGFILLIIFILLAGIKMATASSNATRFSEAAQAFRNVLIGGLVVLGTGVIIATLAYVVGVPYPIPIFCTGDIIF